ncbi:MAG: hypothetical protein WDZ76_10730 [Pseudohongiellaceae bacterium]
MNKLLYLGLALIASLMFSQTALADGRRHDGWGSGWSAGSSWRHDRGFRRHYDRGRSWQRNSYHFPRRYDRHRRSNSSFRFSFNSYYNRYSHSYPSRHRYARHDSHSSGSFLGGLVLGSLLSSSHYPTRTVRHETVRYVRPAPVVTRDTVYVEQPARTATVSPTPVRRSLLRDLEGNCFERSVDSGGTEIRVQVDARQCDF